jgi:hypothetical protein
MAVSDMMINRHYLWAANFLYTKAIKPYNKMYQLSLTFIPFILAFNFLDAECLAV